MSQENPSRSDAPPARPSRLAVLGAGAWGSVLAWLLAERGHEVALFVRDAQQAAHWTSERTDPHGRVPVTLPPSVVPTTSLRDALADSAGIFLVVPNAGLDALLAGMDGDVPDDAVLVSCSKGLFAPELVRPSRNVERAVPGLDVVVLSGPNLAGEIAAGLPAAATVASRAPHATEAVQGWLTSDRFRVYTSADPIGVEVAGAYKNVIALAAGMCDALGLGENTKAALITRGLAETVRLGRHLGGQERTFYGLAGVGDLIATCASGASRNRTAGERLAQGESLASLQSEGITAEGLGTVAAVADYAERHGLALPIAERVAAVALHGRPADEALATLLARDPREEFAANRR